MRAIFTILIGLISLTLSAQTVERGQYTQNAGDTILSRFMAENKADEGAAGFKSKLGITEGVDLRLAYWTQYRDSNVLKSYTNISLMPKYKGLTGGVGIGINDPDARLHVKGSKDGFNILFGDSNTGGGYKVINYYNTANNASTFRAGTLFNLNPYGGVDGSNYWNVDSLQGSVSTVVLGGINNRATGTFTFTGGGNGNYTKGVANVILGGERNYISDSTKNSFVTGGSDNKFLVGENNVSVGSGGTYVDSARSCSFIGSYLDTVIGSSIGGITVLSGGNNDVKGNYIVPTSSIGSIILGNNNRVIDNSVTGVTGPGGSAGIQYCYLFDNCEIKNCAVNGDNSFIWDLHALENCSFDSLVINGENGLIDMLVLNGTDTVYNVAINGDNSQIRDFNLSSASTVKNVVLNGDGTYFKWHTGFNSHIENVTLGAGESVIGLHSVNSDLRNITVAMEDVSVINFDKDMTGVFGKIQNVTAIGGRVGVGTIEPPSLLTVTGGDVFITDATKGVIHVDTADNTCWRETFTSGAPVYTQITCPTYTP